MTKVLVDVDDHLLAKAAHKLGTSTKKDTINTALAQAAEDSEADRQAIDRFERVADLISTRLSEVSRDEMWR